MDCNLESEFAHWGLWLGEESDTHVRHPAPAPCSWGDIPVTVAEAEWATVMQACSPLTSVAVRVGPFSQAREMISACSVFCERTDRSTIDLLVYTPFDLERIKAGLPFQQMQQVRDAGLAQRFALAVTTCEDALWAIDHTPISAIVMDEPMDGTAWATLSAAAREMEMVVLTTARSVGFDRDVAERMLREETVSGVGWPL